MGIDPQDLAGVMQDLDLDPGALGAILDGLGLQGAQEIELLGVLDSLPGAVIGGLLLGFIISFVNVYLSPEDVFLAIMATLLLVLIVKPQGILGKKDSRRV